MSSSAGLDTMDAPMDVTHQSSPLSSPWSSQTLHLLDESIDIEASTGFRFFDLPRELRDMVYTILYGERRVVKLQSRVEFRAAENSRRQKGMRGNEPTTFPESSLGHLLSVNKQFFREAAMVWTARKIFQCNYGHTLTDCLSRPHSMDRQVLQHITEVSILCMLTGADAKTLTRFLPRLARVSIELHACVLETTGMDRAKREVWEEVFSDAALASTRSVSNLLTFRGLRSLTAKWSSLTGTVYTLEEQDTMNQNMVQIQKLLNDVVTRAPESSCERESVPTFDQALSDSIAFRKSRATAEVQIQWDRGYHADGPAPLLLDHEVPQTEADFVRLALLRPKAILNWMLKAKAALAG